MKSALVVTRAIAALTSSATDACCAFRSTNGTFPLTRLRFAKHVRPLVKAFEANQLGDGFDADGRAAGHDGSSLDILRDDAAGSDERACLDLDPRQDGRVRTDAHVVLDRSAEHAI